MGKISSRTAPSDRVVIDISDSSATDSDIVTSTSGSDNELSRTDSGSDNGLNVTETDRDSEMTTTNPNTNDRKTLLKATRQLTSGDSNSDGPTSPEKALSGTLICIEF